jgi:hypothetical protein
MARIIDRLIESSTWPFEVRITIVLIFVGFASAAFLLNRTQSQWRLSFLLKAEPFGFTCSFRDFFHGQFLKMGIFT